VIPRNIYIYINLNINTQKIIADLSDKQSEKMKENKSSLYNLFAKLDLNADGKIDLKDLKVAVETMQFPQVEVPVQAQKYFSSFKAAMSDLLSKLDVNADGQIDVNDLKTAMESMTLPALPSEAQEFITEHITSIEDNKKFKEFAEFIKEHLRVIASDAVQNVQTSDTDTASATDQKIAPPIHLDVEISAEEYNALYQLFVKLDLKKDGKIDLHDLTKAMEDMKLPHVPGHVQEFFNKYDTDGDGYIDFNEFVLYVKEHEKDLKSYFKRIDTNKDGAIDAGEIVASFKKMGVHLDTAEAQKLLERMDKDGTLKIDWNEWRNYLILTPSSSIHDVLRYWRHSSIIDIGENGLVPDDFTETELKTGMWWRHLVAGGAAGAVSRTCTAPLDRLKIMLQVHGNSKNNLTIKSGFMKMLREGGVKSLWRGNGINVIKIAPESAIKFMAYEQIKGLFRGDTNRELLITERLMSGSAAGAISQTIIYPMEVLKTRLALRKTGQYAGIFDCGRQIAQQEGWKSFYRGYVPNLLGIIPYAGIDLAIYETLKKQYMKRNKEQDPGIVALLLCGTISSTCGQLASYPLALIRTRLQAQARKGPDALSSKDTMTSVFKNIIKTDGPRGLYRGITPNFLKVAPAVSISYVVYENARTAMGIKSS